MENLFTIEDMLKITWASLSNPISLAVFTVLFMQLIGKNVIELGRYIVLKFVLKKEVVPVLDGSEDWPLRGVLFNFVTYAFTFVLARMQISDTFAGGDAFVLSILASTFSISVYEIVKNMLKIGGVELITKGYKWH